MEYPFKDLLPLDEVLAREGYYKDWTHLDPEVFYSLTQISEYIKTKGYGVDVRLLIAQLAEHFGLKTTQVVDLANSLSTKHDALKDQFDVVIRDATSGADWGGEIVLARGGKPTLGKRLDETARQLVLKAKQSDLDATNASIADFNDRVDEIITTPVDGSITQQEIIDARQGETSLGENITSVKTQVDDIEQREFRLENKIVNGNFDDLTGWKPTPHYAISASNNELLASVNILGSAAGIEPEITLLAGHKYYFKFGILPKYATTRTNILLVDTGEYLYAEGVKANEWNNFSWLLEPTSQINTVRINHRTNADYVENDVVKFEKVICIDLTETFGSGNEPTVEQMDRFINAYPNIWWDKGLTNKETGLLALIETFFKQGEEEEIEGDNTPEYFLTEAEDTLNKVYQYTQAPCFSTFLITDTHYTPTYKAETTARNMKLIADKVKIDSVSHCGDIVNGNLQKTVTEDIIKESMYQLKSVGDVFITPGNHDFNTFLTGHTEADRTKNPDWYALTQRYSDDKTIRDGNSPYFYVDYPKVKIRAVYINSYHYNEDISSTSNSWSVSLRTWLSNEALVTENGWGVVFFSHVPFVGDINYGGVTPNGSTQLQDIILNYIDPVAEKEVIGWFYGHSHTEAVFNVDGIPFPFIMTQNASLTTAGVPMTYNGVTSVVYPRVYRTVTEELWDVVVIRRDLRKIYCVRFGAGEDREIDY